jgi:hypothetical protein
VVYYNPVYGQCFDASKRLKRCFARDIGYGPEEIASAHSNRTAW